MKKFNWGWGIAIFYSMFVAFMLFMVWNASKEKVEMVSKDYYKDELAFQGQIDKENRTQALTESLKWQVTGKGVTLKFPSSMLDKNIKADVLFYCPSNSDKDFSASVMPGADGSCKVQSEKFEKGTYNMQVNWTAGGASYYNEAAISIK